MERLPEFLAIKADIASRYQQFFAENGLTFVGARAGTTPNFWLNALVMKSVQERAAGTTSVTRQTTDLSAPTRCRQSRFAI